MRIRSLKVDRFAAIDGLEMDVPEGLVVVSGDNESGKSSLMDFMRTGLFASTSKKRYPVPSNDDRGHLTVETNDGLVMTIDRKGRKLLNRDGGPLPADLFNEMQLKTYEGIFAIGLKDLEDREALSTERTRGRMGIPTGVRNLTAVFTELEKGCDDIMGQRAGSSKEAERLLSEIRELENQISELNDDVSRFDSLVREREERAAELEDIIKRQGGEGERLSWLRTVNSQRDNWLRMMECDELIAAKEHADSFPPDGRERLSAARNRREGLVDELRTLHQHKGSVEMKMERLTIDPAVLNESEEIKDLSAQVPLRARTLEDISRLQAAIRSKEEALRKERQRLDWDDESIMSADVSLSLIDSSIRTEESIGDLRGRLRLAEDRHRGLEASISDAEDAEAEEPVPFEDARPSLRKAQSLLREIELLRNRGDPLPFSLAFIFIGLLIPVSVAGAFISGIFEGLAIAIALSSPSPVLLAIGFKKRSEEKTVMSERLTSVEDMETSLEALIPSDLDRDWNGIRAWEDREAERRDEMQRSQTLERIRQENLTRLERDRRRLDEMAMEIDSLRQSLGDTEEEWEMLLRERGWPHREEPELVRETIRIVTNIRSISGEIAAMNDELAVKRDSVRDLESRMVDLVERLGIDSAEFNHAAYRLDEALRVSTDSRVRYDGFQERLIEMNLALADLEDRIATTDSDIAQLLEPYGDEGTFLATAEDRHQLQEARRERDVLRTTLMSSAGNPDAYERMLNTMSGMDRNEAEEEISALEDVIGHLTEERDRIQRELGGIDDRIASMSTDDLLSRKRQELSEAEASMGDTIRRWSMMQTARRMLEEATAEFEKEKQPEVVRRAERYLRTMTGRDYTLMTDLGKGTIMVLDKDLRKEEDMWSSGLGDQVNLSLRLALARAMGNPEPLPIILDDILVRFDPTRRLGAAKAIAEVAAEQQVLFFTCDPAVGDSFRRIGADATFLRLQSGRLLPEGGEEVLG